MFTEDLSTFFNATSGFAQTVTVAGQSVAAIFDNAGTLGDVGMLGMTSTAPMLTLATADVPATPIGATVVVGAISYLVAAHEPDGTGISRLMLESAA